MSVDQLSDAEKQELQDILSQTKGAADSSSQPKPERPDPSPRHSEAGKEGEGTGGAVSEWAVYDTADREKNPNRARKLRRALKREARQPDPTEAAWLAKYAEEHPRGRPADDDSEKKEQAGAEPKSPPPVNADLGGKKEPPPVAPPPAPDPWAQFGDMFDFDSLTTKFAESWGEWNKEISEEVRELGGMAMPDEVIFGIIVPCTKLTLDLYIIPVVKMVLTDPRKAAPVIALMPTLILAMQRFILRWNREKKERERRAVPQPEQTAPQEARKEEPRAEKNGEPNFVVHGIMR